MLVPIPHPKPELIECGAETFPRGDISALADAILRLATCPATWESAVETAKITAGHYSWAAIAAKRIACYREILGDGCRPKRSGVSRAS